MRAYMRYNVCMKKFVRKLIRTGTHSYSITVPKELIEEFGWKKHQKLEIIHKGNKPEFVVRDGQKENTGGT